MVLRGQLVAGAAAALTLGAAAVALADRTTGARARDPCQRNTARAQLRFVSRLIPGRRHYVSSRRLVPARSCCAATPD
jgi:hypothetical protein